MYIIIMNSRGQTILFYTGDIPEFINKEGFKMRIKIYYETLNGEKKYSSLEMKKTHGNTYFDYYCTFKRCDDKIKEDFIIIIYDNNDKIIHREHVRIHWITNPKDKSWQYGITICGDRVVSEVRYGNKILPSCYNDNREQRYYIDVQAFDKKGRPLYDNNGCPITIKQYCSCGSKVKEASSTEFPKGVLHNLFKNYFI